MATPARYPLRPAGVRRSLLVHGLHITLSRPRAILWTYFFNLAIALLFSWRLKDQLDSILTHSLASQRLTFAFDLGVAANALQRLQQNAPDTGRSGLLGPAVYLLIYFFLVPGTLFTYQTAAPARLAILLSIGFQRFWRFVRIALLTLIVSAIILGPLFALQSAWADHVEKTLTGRRALVETLAGYLVLLVVASILRLYFDLVEVYTIHLGEQIRPDGHPDRRVRRVLLPALRTLRANFPRALATFLSLLAVGIAVFLLTARLALHTLAQPHVWSLFLLAQAGLLALLFTRFWQRGAETVLACDNPLPPRFPPGDPLLPFLIKREKAAPLTQSRTEHPLDPQPDPEPAAPSLPEPDPGVFHHDPPGDNS
jgi:hypothetical protein